MIIKVILFKIKQWYGNALKAYTDETMQTMSKDIYDQSSDMEMSKMHHKNNKGEN